MRIATFVSLFLLSGCGQSNTIAGYLRENGLTPRDCGSVQAGQCGSWAPSTADQAVYACVNEAFAACESARARMTSFTDEGDPITHDLLVERTAGGCTIVEFVDTRADDFGPKTLTRSRCQGLRASDGCGGLLSGDACVTDQ